LNNNKTGLTMVEIMIATLLLSVIFLAVWALYGTSQRFYFGTTDQVMISYELQPAMQHIYEHVMLGIGDKANPPITEVSGQTEFSLEYIDKKDNTQKIGYYRIANGKLEFDGNNDDVYEESFGSTNVTFLIEDPVTHVQLSRFYLDPDTDNNMLKIQLTAEFSIARSGTKKRSTLYAACYPRIASFN